MASQLSFEYNALRDDHPETRRKRFWFFLLVVALLALGSFFLYRYFTGWQGESSLILWWFVPGLLCFILGGTSLTRILTRAKSMDKHLERYVKIDQDHIYWWLDINETPQKLALADIQSAEFTFRDIHLKVKDGTQHTLHTYLILSPAKEKMLREQLEGRFG
ncbi:MAG: hypothetical protein AAF741_10715 [Bacteroidota bacterium]